MPLVFAHSLVFRLAALGVLVFCLILVSRAGGNLSLVSSAGTLATSSETQEPTITVEPQADAPLVISSPRILASDSQFTEFAFNLTNVFTKPIRAYAIREDVYWEKQRSSKYLFSNLAVAGKPPLGANLMITSFDTNDMAPGKHQQIVLSIDYVEFADGTAWGGDSGSFAETSAGQRAAATLITARLQDVVNSRDGRDVLRVIEQAQVEVQPSATQSERWRQGFRFAVASVTNRFKRAHKQGGSKKLRDEFSELTTQLKVQPRAN